MPFNAFKTLAPAAAFCLTLLVSACAHDARISPVRESAPRAPVIEQGDPAVALLNFARQLNQATPAQRAAAVNAARQSMKENPGAYSYAHMALAYGTPGQTRYTPDEAARYARRALEAEDASWSPAARQYLHDYARIYRLLTRPSAPSKSTPAPADDASETHSEPAKTPEHSHNDARIAQLQAELDEAHRKLRELANIEDRLGDAQP